MTPLFNNQQLRRFTPCGWTPKCLKLSSALSVGIDGIRVKPFSACDYRQLRRSTPCGWTFKCLKLSSALSVEIDGQWVYQKAQDKLGPRWRRRAEIVGGRQCGGGFAVANDLGIKYKKQKDKSLGRVILSFIPSFYFFGGVGRPIRCGGIPGSERGDG